MNSPGQDGPRRRRVYFALTAAAAAAVLAVTLFPVEPNVPSPGQVDLRTDPNLCLVCGQFGTADFLLNAAFFLPLGFFVCRAVGTRRGLVLAVLTGLSLSAVVEAGQLFLPGRFSTLGDLLANTLGAGTGGVIGRWRREILAPSERRARFLSVSAGAGSFAVLLGTGLLLVPSPTGERNWVQWTPELGHYEAYRGHVLRSRLGDTSLSPGRLDAAASEAVRAAIRRGARATARVRLGPPPDGLAPILSLYDDRQQENLLLGQDRHDLVLQVRYRADALRLRRPEIRLRDALAGHAAGDTVRLAGWRPVGKPGTDSTARPGDAYCLAAGEVDACGLGFPPGRGWTLLLHPRGLPAGALRAFDGAWTALLFLPLGLWAVRRRASALGVLLAGGGLFAAPALTPLLWPGAAEAVGAVVGLATGRMLGRVARRPT